MAGNDASHLLTHAACDQLSPKRCHIGAVTDAAYRGGRAGRTGANIGRGGTANSEMFCGDPSFHRFSKTLQMFAW